MSDGFINQQQKQRQKDTLQKMEKRTNKQGVLQSDKTTSHLSHITLLKRHEQRQKFLKILSQNFENKNNSKNIGLGPKASIDSQGQIKKDKLIDLGNLPLPLPQYNGRNVSIEQPDEGDGDNESIIILKFSENNMNNSQSILDFDQKVEINAENEGLNGDINIKKQRIGALVHDKGFNVNIKQPFQQAGNEPVVRNVGTPNPIKELTEKFAAFEKKFDSRMNRQEQQQQSKIHKRIYRLEKALELQQQQQSKRNLNIERKMAFIEIQSKKDKLEKQSSIEIQQKIDKLEKQQRKSNCNKCNIF